MVLISYLRCGMITKLLNTRTHSFPYCIVNKDNDYYFCIVGTIIVTLTEEIYLKSKFRDRIAPYCVCLLFNFVVSECSFVWVFECVE